MSLRTLLWFWAAAKPEPKPPIVQHFPFRRSEIWLWGRDWIETNSLADMRRSGHDLTGRRLEFSWVEEQTEVIPSGADVLTLTITASA